MTTILYINATGEISGAERSLLSLLDALDRDRWTPLVCSPAGPLAEEVAARGIPHFPIALPQLHRPHSLRQALKLSAAIRQGRRQLQHTIHEANPGLLHANTTSAMLIVPSAVQLPIIWHVRDFTPLGFFGPCLYRRASRIAVISSALRAEVQRYGRDAGKKITMLPPAVDITAFQPPTGRSAFRTTLHLPDDVPLIGCIAQFVPWKRHHLLLDTLSLLRDQPWHVILAGADFHAEPAYLVELRERIARPPFTGRVTWLPWQHEPAALLSGLDICALTSQREPFGRVLVEAMACGIPVVAVDEGGARDIVIPEENGLLAPADPAKLAAALRRLLDNVPLRERLGQAGRRFVSTSFSLEQQSLLLDDLYSTLIDG